MFVEHEAAEGVVRLHRAQNACVKTTDRGRREQAQGGESTREFEEVTFDGAEYGRLYEACVEPELRSERRRVGGQGRVDHGGDEEDGAAQRHQVLRVVAVRVRVALVVANEVPQVEQRKLMRALGSHSQLSNSRLVHQQPYHGIEAEDHDELALDVELVPNTPCKDRVCA